jgi:amino-acid N-acetyltransferase
MAKQQEQAQDERFVSHIRLAAPYVHAHRGATFVLMFGGEAVEEGFANLIHDIALLQSLGIRLVLVHGARPQIERRLKKAGAELRYVNDLRVTDDEALACVKDAAGSLRVEIEARLSMGLVNTPMSGARLRVSSGNFVVARPLGVRDGVDYCHTGEVRRIDADGIGQHLQEQRIVLLSPLGYSPTGEVFNVSAEEIAAATAVALHADKLLLLTEEALPRDGRRRPIRQLSLTEAGRLLDSRRKMDPHSRRQLELAVECSQRGVKRIHLIDRRIDGGLLLELFTRDGVGTLVSAETYEGLQPASIDDVGGILELIEPLESEGMLVKRSREMLEMEINHFLVVKRDGMIVACAALYPYGGHVAELACFAVHPDYRNSGRGAGLLEAIERRARKDNIRRLFILTTRTAQWFQENGFQRGDLADLPVKKRSLYNYQRNSRVFVKALEADDA